MYMCYQHTNTKVSINNDFNDTKYNFLNHKLELDHFKLIYEQTTHHKLYLIPIIQNRQKKINKNL